LKNYYFEPSDIIVFPVIDWHYRFQRPQQISTRLALHGHRVFYLRTYFLEGTKPACQPIRSDISLIDVQLGLLNNKNIVADQLDESSKRILLDQFDFLRHDLNISKAICFVDLPFWGPLVLELQKIYGWKIIYNSMDQLGGFSNVTPYMLEPEDDIIKKGDLILATSHLLYNEKSRLNPNCLLVPNGTDFDHFNYSPEILPDELIDMKKPIIGYYGAMSDWLDTELIHTLASVRPNWNFILIGRIESADVSRLKHMSNVFLLGEKPYELLPGYLQHFDTCIIPFKKIQLTEATNPVKLFEFLSAGKSIVATDLDELRYYQEYVRLASSVSEWLAAIELALDDYLPVQIEKRLSFARQNTWNERILLIEDAIQSISQDQVDASVSLPLILSRENLVSVRLLTQQDGVDYWCMIYEKDGVIYKQASFDLAEREARFLAQFGSDYFPGLLDLQSEGDYSVITFRKIQGQNLHDALSHINSSVTVLYNFIQHCLNILMDLEREGVIHRNICRENILVQDGKPVLLDFGWAISEQEPYFSPLGLGGYERPPDGSFSDVYSMGKILEYVNRQHYRAFDWVISLMTMKDSSLRITDLITLKILFDTALKITLETRNDRVKYA
jgi:glycosyltransferase involved in cell wall biosynthesis/tRNA A-37 threonylcarbamoyl transferase component Bud32